MIQSENLVREALQNLSDEKLLDLTQQIYEIPSLAAWRAAELKVLRHLEFQSPLLELGCGTGLFSSLLFDHVDCGIDISPKEIEICSRRTSMYGRVACMDARTLDFPAGSFQTVFANCVIEHIPGLDMVLAECRRVLRAGGRVIATVPLRDLESELLIPGEGYARLRAQQLQHINLHSRDEWIARFRGAGFESIETSCYLPGALARRWDRVDGPICFGLGPYNIGNIYRYSIRLLPASTQAAIKRGWTRYFAGALGMDPRVRCSAMVLQASAPAV